MIQKIPPLIPLNVALFLTKLFNLYFFSIDTNFVQFSFNFAISKKVLLWVLVPQYLK